MVDVTIRECANLGGEVCAPSSKAYTHRALVAALLSNGISEISDPLASTDTQATLEAIMAFGAEAELQEDLWKIEGPTNLKAPERPINCKESGTTARFMLPVAALAPGSSTFFFGSSLRKRPIAPLLKGLKQQQTEFDFELNRKGWIKIHGGGLTGGKVLMRGDISSQFISGLLFICPKAGEDTEIAVTTHLESKSYVQMTIEVLEKHGVKIRVASDFRRFNIPSPQKYEPYNHKVPGDFSSAAFLLAAAAVTSSKLRVKNLDCHTLQGDNIILEILKETGSKVIIGNEYVEVEGGQLNSINVDVRDIPDLAPVCAVLACYSHGTSRLYNAKRLRYKESDRLSSLCTELSRMGAKITESRDRLIVIGEGSMHGATINPHKDHRVAMACAVAALGAKGETRIQHSECVRKSYPRFFQDLRRLGVEVVGKQLDR